MRTDESLEISETRVAEERDAVIARTRHALELDGETECVSCGDEIPATRRAAYPACRRCVDCQEQFERRQRYR